MKMTYIGHSGVALFWDNCNWVIDYYNGTMPAFDPAKKLFVFASHFHGDHLNLEVFKLFKDFENVQYIFSTDCEKKVNDNKEAFGITEKQLESITYISAGGNYAFDDGCGNEIALSTYLSTDEGVAFLFDYAGKTVYHAGDLHWWAWPDNEPDYDKWMKDTFFGEIYKMKGKTIDLGFVPVDRRIEHNVFLGADAVMRELDVKKMFPIHMQGEFGLTKELKADPVSESYRDRIFDIDFDGQEFEIEL